MRPSRWRPCIVWVGLCVGLFCFGTPAQAGEGWWGDLDQGQHVRLNDILRAPRTYSGRTLTFVCVYHRQESLFDSFRTRFSYRNFDNFSVWPDGAELWDPAPYKKDFPFLYLPKSHPQRGVLHGLEMFSRIEVTTRIGAVSRGRPYLEVLSLRRTGHRLGRSFFRELKFGRNLMNHGSSDGVRSAARKYRDLLITRRDLPKGYVAKVRRLYANALRELGEEGEAARIEQGGKIGDSWGRSGATWSDRPKAPNPEDDIGGELDFGDELNPRDERARSAEFDQDPAPSENLPAFPGADDAPGSVTPAFPDGAPGSHDDVPGLDAPGDGLGMPPGLSNSPRSPSASKRRNPPAFPDEEDDALDPPMRSESRREPSRDAPSRERSRVARSGPGPRGYGAFAMPRRSSPASNSPRRRTRESNRRNGRRPSADRDADTNEWRMGSAKDLPAPGTSPMPGRERYPESGSRTRGLSPAASARRGAPPLGGMAPRRRTRIAGVK